MRRIMRLILGGLSMDDDDTLDSLSTFLNRFAKAKSSGRLSVDDVQSAYTEHTGADTSRDEVLTELSQRYLCLIDEISGELRFCAVLNL